jgi:hypothetical protein
MRVRLGASLGGAALTAVILFVSSSAASAAPPPGGVSGSGAEASGELLNGGRGARVGAGSTQFVPTQGGGSQEGGGDDGITCIPAISGGEGQAGEEVAPGDLETELGAREGRGEDEVFISYRCSDRDGNVWYTEAPWAPGDPVNIDPAVLMEMALETLYFPAPSGATNPPIGTGTVAQLDTYFWVDNWAAVSETASAGPVSATVTATPVSQTWTIEDSIRGTQEFSCEGPGVVYDPTSGAAPPAGACTWRPPHSSAGQAARHPETGEPCFPTTVTVTWGVAWTASGAPGGGQLDPGSSSASTCLVVDEIQAVVTDVP